MCKKFIFSLVVLFSVASVDAQFRKIPAEVTDSFKVKYANASGVSWKDKLLFIQADFQDRQQRNEVMFSSKGEWLKTETKYSFDKVPIDVKDGFKKSKYADMPVQEVLLIEEKDKATSTGLL
jgi:hypothetical protein